MPNNQLLTYDYFKIPRKEIDNKQLLKEIYFPFIPIRIAYDHKLGLPFRALVDSGASRSLLPGALGIQVGVNILSGKRVKIFGIGRKEIIAYTHKLKIHLGLLSFETEADFSFDQDIPLLGREGFFDLFQKIIFDEHFHQLQLILKIES